MTFRLKEKTLFNLNLKGDVSTLLPKKARDALTRAAPQPERVRLAAIDNAIAYVKEKYPLYFKEKS